MIIDELMPFIDAHYRTLGSPEIPAWRIVLGGLAQLYFLASASGVFGKLAVVSPSVWWNRGVILRMIRDLPAPHPLPGIPLEVGTAEGAHPRRILRDARYLREAPVPQRLAPSAKTWRTEVEGSGCTMKVRGARACPASCAFCSPMKIHLITTGGTIEKIYPSSPARWRTW